jgi:hypothetical protein
MTAPGQRPVSRIDRLFFTWILVGLIAASASAGVIAALTALTATLLE